MAVNAFNVQLFNSNGALVTYSGVETITLSNASSSVSAIYTAGAPLDYNDVQIMPDFTSGDMYVDTPPGYVVRDALILKPADMSDMIAKGSDLMGVSGNYVTPGTTLSVSLAFTESMSMLTFSADDDERWSRVDIIKPDTLDPANILLGVNIAGIDGFYIDQLQLYAANIEFHPWRVLGIGEYAFYYNRTLHSVIAPSVGRIQQYAFTSATLLSMISFMTCSFIGSYAFMSCTSLTSVDIPLVNELSAGAFSGCTSLSEITLPACETIASSAFRSCSRLTSISLPLVKSLGGYAFYGCYSLSTISLPLVSYVGTYAFAYCSKLQRISISHCSTIGTYAFAYCSSLSYVDISGCASFGSTGTFSNCTNLSSLYLTCTSSVYLTSSTFTGSAFINVSLFTIGGNAVLGSYVFRSKPFTAVSLMGYSTMFPGAFCSCSNLQKAYLATGGPWTSTFYACSRLEQCVAPNAQYIGNSAFYSCSNLQRLSVYALSYISTSAFYGCSRLSVIKFQNRRALTAALGSNAFFNTPFTNSALLGYFGSFYVPSSYLSAYQADSYWSSLSARFTVITPEIDALFTT